ncbi:HugZ Putative heme iron utilization protein [Rhabdaerophilaceae bacterium]
MNETSRNASSSPSPDKAGDGNAIPRDPRQPADFDPVALGRHLLRIVRVGALGTLDPRSGFPVATLVSVATDLDGVPITLVSGLSHHTKNMAADARCSLLLSEGGRGDPLARPRLTLLARAQTANDATVRRRFLARHPKAKLYVDFPDFSFFRLVPERMMLNGGFARAFDGPASHLLADLPDRHSFGALEQSAIDHLNADHADTLVLYARVLCKLPEGPWRATGLDPHGLDLALGDRTARLAFPTPLLDAHDIRQGLHMLAERARAELAAAGASED